MEGGAGKRTFDVEGRCVACFFHETTEEDGDVFFLNGCEDRIMLLVVSVCYVWSVVLVFCKSRKWNG